MTIGARVRRGVRMLGLIALGLVGIGVRAAAAQNCSVDVTGVTFGAYDVYASVPVEATGSVTVRCLLALAVQVQMDAGQHGTFTARRMEGNGDLLGYNLYTTGTTVWGDGTGTTDVVWMILTILNLSQTRTVFGRIPPGQNVAIGSYTDSVTVTIVF